MTYYDDQRWLATVNPEVMDAMLELCTDPRTLERFWAKVDLRTFDHIEDGDECWIWTGALSSEGYGNFHLNHNGRARTARAHRFSWFIANPVPLDHDLFLDHIFPTCRGRYCINPMHLEPVTNLENSLRATGVGATVQRINRSAHLIERDTRELANAVTNGLKLEAGLLATTERIHQ